jgi:hypothetical protein
MSPIESVLFRMLEAASLPGWQTEPYYYSWQYRADCDELRGWMRTNGVEQKFMLYGDIVLGGTFVKKEDR